MASSAHELPLRMDDQTPDPSGPASDVDRNGAQMPVDDHQTGPDESAVFHRDSGTGEPVKADAGGYPEKSAVKPNKVYVGGLPEHTRREDLQNCFGKIGNIVNIELKVGYGFVEFDNREAAEESVAKYNEGYFMGNKIRVEMSRGGSKASKVHGEPGACFKCGQLGHWARECPNPGSQTGSTTNRRSYPEPPLIDRIQPSREYTSSRDYPTYRDDYGRYPPRDPRYGYDYPPPPAGRDYRRAPSPPRDYRDYPAGPPPVRSARDYDDYRMRGPPPPPATRYERPGYYPSDSDGQPPGYPPRSYTHTAREPHDRYDRRPAPAIDRYGSYPPAPGSRPRTPPGGPPRAREEYDRPPRDYPAAEVRSRPAASPTRYPDYPPRSGSAAGSPRYRRRSQSPAPRSTAAAPYESAGYSTASREGFAGNGYSGGVSGLPASGPPPRSAGSSRDYPARNGRDGRDAGDAGGSYRRP